MEQRPEHSGRQGIVAAYRSTAAGPVRRVLSAALVAVGLFLAGYTGVGLLWMALGTVGLIVGTCLVVVAFLIAAARRQRLRLPVAIALTALTPAGRDLHGRVDQRAIAVELSSAGSTSCARRGQAVQRHPPA